LAELFRNFAGVLDCLIYRRWRDGYMTCVHHAITLSLQDMTPSYRPGWCADHDGEHECDGLGDVLRLNPELVQDIQRLDVRMSYHGC
jgi:hypothetical protein